MSFIAIVLVLVVVFLGIGMVLSVPYRFIKRRQQKAGVRTTAQQDIATAVADGVKQAMRNQQTMG